MPTDQQLGTILAGGTALGLEPADLLRRFADRGDEAAFAALVARHGPMVLATCRRILPHQHDADDAFQATFLVLARRAGTIADPERLAPWLHGVARRVATKARTLAARRRAMGGQPLDPDADPLAEVAVAPPPLDGFELRPILDEELARLPAKYRDPLVLCYLEGLTHDQAAGQLAWPVGTVRSRLAGGRDRLRSRLARRGYGPPAALPTSLPLAVASRPLQVATVRLAFRAASATVATPAAVVLARGVLTSMFLTKVQALAAATATALAVAAVGVATARPQDPAAGQPAAPANPAAAAPAPAPPSHAPPERAVPAAVDRQFDAANARIKALEADLAALKAKLAPEPAPQLTPAPRPAASQAIVRALSAPGTGGTQEPTPDVQSIGGSPTLMMITSGNRDRVTMINLQTQQRATWRLARPAATINAGWTEMRPLGLGESREKDQPGAGLVGMAISGKAISQAAVFDRRTMAWFQHALPRPASLVEPRMRPDSTLVAVQCFYSEPTDKLILFDAQDQTWPTVTLPEPVSGYIPAAVLMPGIACYEAGRFVCMYHQARRRWTILELKAGLPDGRLGGSSTIRPIDKTLQTFHDDRLIVPEGDQLYIYDATSGEWTQIDINEDGDDIFIAADSPVWQAIDQRCRDLGYQARHSFNADYDALLPKARGKRLIVTSVGDRTVPPAERYGQYFPLSAAEIRQRVDRDGAGVARKRLDDGTRVVLLYARDVAGLVELARTWEPGPED